MKATPLWTPSIKTVENSRIAQFIAEINAAHRLSRQSYSGLHAFSSLPNRSFPGDFFGAIGARLERRPKFAPQETSV